MVNKPTTEYRRPILTIVSLVFTVGFNIFAWYLLILKAFTVPGGAMFELFPLYVTAFLLFVIDTLGFLIIIGATLRKESMIFLRKAAYAVSLLSFPIYIFALFAIY